MITFLFTLLCLLPILAALCFAASLTIAVRRRHAIRAYDPHERDTLPSALPAFIAAGGFGWRERGKV